MEPTLLEREAVLIAQRLIQIDSSNFGDNAGPVEREAAEYVAELLREVGYEPTLVEAAPGRTSVLLRIPGADPALPGLVLHGHSDVVPAPLEGWQVDPFGGVIKDGMLWGRGAVDMKHMLGMMLAVVRDMRRNSWQPQRDLVLAIFADEEAGGQYGSHYVVKHHPEFFEGAGDAISEVGGFSVTVGGRRVYLVQTAEKGMCWLRLTARGTAGHGSLVNRDNAINHLLGALDRIVTYEWPQQLTPTVRALLAGAANLRGESFDPADSAAVAGLVAAFGTYRTFLEASLATMVNLTELHAGYKANVIPGEASAVLDMRTIPERQEEAMETIARLAGPGVEVTVIHKDVGLEVPFEGALVDAMVAALTAEDPDATVLPYMLSGGTDNKALSRLGIKGYGFAPLQLPADFNYGSLIHGVDERVPVAAIHFGARTLARLIAG